MIYDKTKKLQNKWDKSFMARGYYIEIVVNIANEVV